VLVSLTRSGRLRDGFGLGATKGAPALKSHIPVKRSLGKRRRRQVREAAHLLRGRYREADLPIHQRARRRHHRESLNGSCPGRPGRQSRRPQTGPSRRRHGRPRRAGQNTASPATHHGHYQFTHGSAGTDALPASDLRGAISRRPRVCRPAVGPALARPREDPHDGARFDGLISVRQRKRRHG
jgi:hypothetical protein